MCCDSWGRKESDMTEQLNCTEPRAICRFKVISIKLSMAFFTELKQVKKICMETQTLRIDKAIL